MEKNTTISHKILLTGFLVTSIITALPTDIEANKINNSVVILIGPSLFPAGAGI